MAKTTRISIFFIFNLLRVESSFFFLLRSNLNLQRYRLSISPSPFQKVYRSANSAVLPLKSCMGMAANPGVSFDPSPLPLYP